MKNVCERESEKNQRRNEKWFQHLKKASFSHGKNCCIWQSDLEIFSASVRVCVCVCVCVSLCAFVCVCLIARKRRDKCGK